MEDFIMGFFSGAWGLKLIFLICIAKILLDIIGAIAFFICFNEKFRPRTDINGSNEITSDHKNYIVGN